MFGRGVSACCTGHLTWGKGTSWAGDGSTDGLEVSAQMHPTIAVRQERPFYPRWGSHIHSMGFHSEWYQQALFFYALNSKCQPRNLSGGRGRARAAAQAALPSHTLQHVDFCSAIWDLYCKYLYFKCPWAGYRPFSLGEEHRPSIYAAFELPT